MAFASALNPPNGLHRLPPLPPSRNDRPPTNLTLPRQFPTRFSSTLALARRRNHRAEVAANKPTIKKKGLAKNEVKEEEEEDVDEDAIETLFKLLEEDLKNDDASLDEEDTTEEDLARLEKEVAEALGIVDDVDVEDEDEDEDDDDVIVSDAQEEEDDEEDEEDEDEEEEEEDEVKSPVRLKTWQLRRLANALKIGRRKTSIKALAAEVCLDRAVVLEFLRDPPPSLLLMCAALPDEPEPAPAISVSDTKHVETVLETTVETSVETVVEKTTDAVELEAAVKVPVHVTQQKFSGQKRLKKAQVETLESVYRKTKRPTNAMISSIVHVTNLPRKRVVKWFEDKRSEEGVPDSRHPYQRTAPNTV